MGGRRTVCWSAAGSFGFSGSVEVEGLRGSRGCVCDASVEKRLWEFVAWVKGRVGSVLPLVSFVVSRASESALSTGDDVEAAKGAFSLPLGAVPLAVAPVLLLL